MYLADSETQSTRGFNANLDFTEILDFQGINPEMLLDENVKIKKIECRVLNGRKVSFNVELDIDAKVFLNENEEMIREVNGIDDIQTQRLNLNLNSLIRSELYKSSSKRKHKHR